MKETREQLLTIPEAATLLALTPATLRKWRAQRRLPVVKLGRAVRVRLADVERLVQVGLVKAIPSNMYRA